MATAGGIQRRRRRRPEDRGAGTLPAHRRVGDARCSLIAAKPDAVLIAGAGTPSALPQKTLLERGYGGVILPDAWHRHAGIPAGRRQGRGRHAVPTGPGVVARELPDSNPVKQVAVAFADKYEAQYGAHTLTQFAGDAYGAWMLLDSAVARALKGGAKPARRNSARCATRWSRPATWPCPMACSIFPRTITRLRRACARDGRGQERPFLLRRAIRTRLVAILAFAAAAQGGDSPSRPRPFLCSYD